MFKIKLLVVEDVLVTALGIEQSVSSYEKIILQKTINRSEEVIPYLKNNDIDIVLLDMRLNGNDNEGLEIINEIDELNLPVGVILHTAYQLESYISCFCSTSIKKKGFVLKDASMNEKPISEIIEIVHYSGYYVSQSISKVITNQLMAKDKKRNKYDLTEREIEVLDLTEQGYRDEEIGERLNLSKSTVKGYKVKIRDKIDPEKKLSEKLTLAGIKRFIDMNLKL